jgi:regulator of sigma E protease
VIGFVHNLGDALILLILFGATIFVHELCHFLVALRLGLVVETFSLGFGPALWQTKRNGIVYKLGWIPFGGYVALPQLDPSGMDKIQGSQEGDAETGRRELPPVSPWKRMAVAGAGVVGNLALGIVLAWVVYASPAPVPSEREAIVGHVATNAPAYAAGLRAGDEVVAVNGETVKSWHDFTISCVLQGNGTRDLDLVVRRGPEPQTLRVPTTRGEMGEWSIEGVSPFSTSVVTGLQPGGAAAQAGVLEDDIVLALDGVRIASIEHFIDLVAQRDGSESVLRVKRKGRDVELPVTPRMNAGLGRAVIGVELSPAEIGVLPWMRYRNPWDQIRGDATEIVRILRALVTPAESRQAAGALGGPVMIITWLWVSIKISIFNAVGFLRFLNINLAILNLLPLPVLDGGHIVFCLWEGITRRRVHPRLVNALTNLFAVLLIGAFVLLTFRDFRRAPRMFKGLRGLFGREDAAEVQQREPAVWPTNAPAGGDGSPAAAPDR